MRAELKPFYNSDNYSLWSFIKYRLFLEMFPGQFSLYIFNFVDFISYFQTGNILVKENTVHEDKKRNSLIIFSLNFRYHAFLSYFCLNCISTIVSNVFIKICRPLYSPVFLSLPNLVNVRECRMLQSDCCFYFLFVTDVRRNYLVNKE